MSNASTETALYVRSDDKALFEQVREQYDHPELGVPKRATFRKIVQNELDRLEGGDDE